MLRTSKLFLFAQQQQKACLFNSFFYSTSKTPEQANDQMTQNRIKGYVNSDPVVVFMKGNKQQPMCGFSKNVKLVLEFHQIPFKDYNVLEDADIREGVKKFGDWPTIPQVYVKGDFIGGSDILIKMHDDGEITEFFEKYGLKSRFSEDQSNNKKSEKNELLNKINK